MANTQASAVPKDGGIAEAFILPAAYKPKVLALTIPAGEGKKLSDAAGYPTSQVPTVVEWVILNDTAFTLRFGGAETTAAVGLRIPPATLPLNPIYFAGNTDPGQSYVWNTGGSEIILQVLFIAKNFDQVV